VHRVSSAVAAAMIWMRKNKDIVEHRCFMLVTADWHYYLPIVAVFYTLLGLPYDRRSRETPLAEGLI